MRTGDGEPPWIWQGRRVAVFTCHLPLRAHGEHDLPDERPRALEGIFLEEAVGVDGGGEREGAAHDGLELPFLNPSDHVDGAPALLLGRGVEHGEAEERAIAGVEGAQGQGGLGSAAGQQDQPAVFAKDRKSVV